MKARAKSQQRLIITKPQTSDFTEAGDTSKHGSHDLSPLRKPTRVSIRDTLSPDSPNTQRIKRNQAFLNFDRILRGERHRLDIQKRLQKSQDLRDKYRYLIL